MSTLGQKRTLRTVRVMSALTPKTDFHRRLEKLGSFRKKALVEPSSSIGTISAFSAACAYGGARRRPLRFHR